MVEIDSWIKTSGATASSGMTSTTTRVRDVLTESSEHVYMAYGDEQLTSTSDSLNPRWLKF